MSVRSGSASRPAAIPNSPDVPIADALSRAGYELAHLAWLLEQRQMHIGPIIQEAAGGDANVMHQMQSFDHIGQKAAGLADFLTALALAAPRQWLVDPAAAARTVVRAELSTRLGFAGEARDSCSTAWGDCEFF